MPVQKILICADQEGAGAAGGIKYLQLLNPLRLLPFNEFAHRILHNIVDDVSRRIIDAACLFDFRFVLDFGPVSRREVDDLPQKLLIDMTQDIGRKNRKLIGTIGIIEAC
jgi:hypothetical protein